LGAAPLRKRLPQEHAMRFRVLAGVFLVSSATLCFEITLTRYFSISQDYHFAFFVVSIAFLGYGSAGTFLSFRLNLPGRDRDERLSLLAFLFGLSILLSFLACNSLPFDFLRLIWESSHAFLVLVYYVALSIPFFFAGLAVSFAISSSPSRVGFIYFFDLAGAGAGTLASLFIFLPAGDRGTMLILSSLALAASLLFNPGRSRWLKVTVLLLLAVEACLFTVSPSWLAFRISAYKQLPAALRYPGARPLLTKWNALSRVDVIDSPAVRYAPGLSLLYPEPLPSQLGLSTDAGELNAVTGAGEAAEDSLAFLSALPSSFPYSIRSQPRVLILEAKGGLDVLAALYFRARSVKVVDSNPLVVSILRRDLAGFSGDIYTRPNVHCLVSNPRSALQKEKSSFDLLVFALADVLGSSGTGEHGFGENYLYTREAFTDALNRLTEEGLASMTLYLLPPPRLEARILATWIESLEKASLDPGRQMMVLRSWGTLSFFIKKSPFTPGECQTFKDFAGKNLFDLVYYPGIRPDEVNLHNRFDRPLYHSLALQLLSPHRREMFYLDYLFRINPVSDDRPFPFHFFKPARMGETYEALGKKWLPFLQGEFLVPALFVLVATVSAFLVLLPVLFLRGRTRPGKRVRGRVILYFGAIGMSFMFIEITLIQKFILFLGHPLYSMALTLFALLLSSAFGSLSSTALQRRGYGLKRMARTAMVSAGLMTAVYILILPVFSRTFIGLGLGTRCGLSLLLIFPLGFLMGIPFPTGIRLLESRAEQVIPWAWGTNAFSSVVSSVAALLVAFWGGYPAVLACAAGGYLAAPFFLGFADHGDEPHP